MLYLGVDLGGTNIKAALVNSEGEILCEANPPTNLPRPAEAVCDDIAALCLQLAEEKDVAGVGVGCPGTVDGGTVLYSNNLDWHDFAMEEYLAQKTGLPVAVGNDANVAALGEAWKGAAAGAQNIIMITLGTGVGGGIIINGKILAGSHGAGGEIGHALVVRGEEEKCNCGNHGCLEQYASATGIVRVAGRVLAASEDDSTLRELQNITAKDVLDAFKAGDAVAVRIMEYVGDLLGGAIAGFTTVVDPEAIVIGGGVSKAGQPLIDCIEKYYQRYAFSSCKETPIVLATLGNDAGIYGAAKMVL